MDMEERMPSDRPIALSRLRPPVVVPTSEHIARITLLERIKTGLSQRFCLVTGFSGSGKTSLLVDTYHRLRTDEARHYRLAWLSLDSNAAEQKCFWQHIAFALLDFWPDLEVKGHVPEFSAPEAFLTDLGNLCFRQLDTGTDYILFLDSVEFLDDQLCRDFLTAFASCLPAQIHVLMAGTYLPLPSSHPLFLNSLFEIEADALLLDMDEINDYLRRRGSEMNPAGSESGERDVDVCGTTIPDGLARWQMDNTRGWFMGIRLLLDGGFGFGQAEGGWSKRFYADRHLDRYFRLKILPALSSRFEEFLIESAVTDFICPALCDYVTGRHNSQIIIDELLDKNLFVTPLNSRRGWYRVNPLFLGWLREQLMRIRPNRIRELNNRASEWYEDNDLIAEAAKHLLMSSDSNLIEHLSAASTLYQPRGQEAFLKSIIATPAANIRESKQLSLLVTWAYVISGRPESALYWLDVFERALTRDPPDLSLPKMGGEGFSEVYNVGQEVAFSIECIKLKCLSMSGKYQETVEAVLALLTQGEHRMDINLRLVFIHTLGESYERLGRLKEAQEQYLRGEAIASLKNSPFYVSFNRYLYLSIEYLYGHLAKVREQCYQALATSDWDYAPYGGLYCLLARVQIEMNQREEATRSLKRASNRLHRVRNMDVLFEINAAHAYLLFIQGSNNQAYERIVQTLLLAENRSIARAASNSLYVVQADIDLARGNLTDATVIVQKLGEIIQPDDQVNTLSYRLLQAELLEYSGQAEKAAALYAEVAGEALTLGILGLALESLLLESAISYRLGQSAKALRTLGEALAIGQRHGFFTTFLKNGETIKAMLRELLNVRKVSAKMRSFAKTLLQAIDERECASRTADPNNGARGAAQDATLTRRESEILELLEGGLTRAEISETLSISINTTKSHINHIFTKLGVNNRLAALSARDASKDTSKKSKGE
jgi:LuxR family maltose regulon positive regulatory protein